MQPTPVLKGKGKTFWQRKRAISISFEEAVRQAKNKKGAAGTENEEGQDKVKDQDQVKVKDKDKPKLYPVSEQTLLYSDVVCVGAAEVLRTQMDIMSGPCTRLHSTQWKVPTEKHTPKVTAFTTKDQTDDIKKRHRGDLEASSSDFLGKAFIPKIQIAFETKPGECPRNLAIERQRRDFAVEKLPSLLCQKYGILTEDIMPRHPLHDVVVHLNKDPDNPAPFPHYLPLHIFDDSDYDCRLPEEWLALGWDEESKTRLPVPALALLPTKDSDLLLDPTDPSICYAWCNVGVLDYDAATRLWLVHRCTGPDWDRVLDDKMEPVRNGGVFDEEGHFLPQQGQTWLPRVLVLFRAEDPRLFAQRLAEAFQRRSHAESELRYHLYADCMPVDGIEDLDEASWKRIRHKTLSTPNIRRHPEMVDEMMERMEEEVKLDYKRSMNRQVLDMVVQQDPETFAYVRIPPKGEKPVPESARYHDVPVYPFKHQCSQLRFKHVLTPFVETITALTKIKQECNRVASQMSLFYLPTPKATKLEDFEQSQSNASNQTSLFLKDSWISSIRAHIRGTMVTVGKGWYDIRQPRRNIYDMSQLKLYMETIKFMMQDALRFLVQDSIHTFTQFIVDACHTMLLVPDDFSWGDDLIYSPFRPKRLPLFLMELVMDTNTVSFSTKLERFEETLMSLFDKAIMATHGVPQMEKFVLEDIIWWGTPLLEAVGKYEYHIVDQRETIRRMIRKALIPTRAYAHEYERYRELFNMDIRKYVEEFKKRPHSADDYRKASSQNNLKHSEIFRSLPSSILIGPFQISTENVKQNLLKKQKALCLALLDQLALELRIASDEASDHMKTVSRRLYDKPPCIEDVVDMRDWIRTIPEKLKEHQDTMDKLRESFDVLDEFQFNLTNDDFNTKWEALSWPYRIEQLVEKTLTNLEEDEERFRKLQEHDHNSFEERLSNLMIQVAGFQNYEDIKKGHEYANEMRRVNKAIRECQQLAIQYNSRERIFGMHVTNYDRINKMMKEFEPFRNLWVTTSDWLRWYDGYMNDPLANINPEDVERNVNEAYKIMHRSVKIFHEHPAVQAIAAEIKRLIEDFKPYIPLIQGLRNPGMKERHWGMIADSTAVQVKLKPTLTFSKCIEMGLQEHVEVISSIADVAGKEYAIETALNKMESEWQNVFFDVQPYKNTGTFIQKCSDETCQLLDDHIVMTQSMSFSPYKAAFEIRLNKWEATLRTTQDVIDEWTTCQRAWMYLEPIFSSEDITRQLPVESKRYQTMERIWRKIMKKAHKEPKVIELCPEPGLLKNLVECNELLDQVQKGLSEYLETKRNSFPRFYFLSDDELLEILSQTRDPTAVQPHLRKCFENVYRLRFESDLKITKLFSAEGEVVDLRETMYPTGNVEDWMSEIERIMRQSVRQIIRDALKDYLKRKRTDWVLTWPGQVVIAGCQTYWSAEVAEAIENGKLKERYTVLLQQLDDLRKLVRQKLTSIGRMTLSALIVIEVHARDVVANIVKENVTNSNAFEWIAQLRYYWLEDENLYQRAVNAQFPYGYEYLGNTFRLVITPLTDRCYLTLTGALHLKFGGAPAGPAGTGKTETTKDLGKAFAIQCVVFNCSDQLDVMAMGKFFKGLASAGAWACFDEFNRIDIEVLSVVAQQVTTIQKAQQQNAERFIFEGVELRLRMSCAVFITMNPGYAGRTELPDNLKALFRPVAMMVPDYALIAEISLFSFGFADARVLSKKIVTTFKLSSEQLSSQDHYDFGMRAVKSVISAAGNLKRQNPNMDEELIALRAIRDVNVPKFLVDDLKLFRGIVSDLFPAIREEPIDYGSLDTMLKQTCLKNGLKDVPGFLNKCIQLFETTVVRHGLMLVGPTSSGKTKCYEVLQKAMTSLKGEMSPSGMVFEAVHTYVLNPKSITMGQLYGEFDPITYEWTDGILSNLIRMGAAADNNDKRWYMFDGPVDAVWIENMNTVLDDNKKLCLTSGEIIKLTEPMTMMFEVADLAVASPATVSRCGMIYLEPSYLGLEPFVECWIKQQPKVLEVFMKKLKSLFDFYMEPAIKFLRSDLKEIVGTVDGGLVFSLLKLMDCHLQPFNPKEGDKPPKSELLGLVPSLLEPWFIFSLVWSVGATCDNNSRVKFSSWLRDRMAEGNCKLPFPPDGMVYDYRLDDGLSTGGGDEDEEEDEQQQISWKNWLSGAPKYEVNPDMKYSDILVPTIDTVRSAYIIGMLVDSRKPILCIGPTGTGKTLTIADKLLKNLPKQFIPDFIVFSAKTSSNQTQDLIDGKLDKRRKGVFGPPLGKYFVFFIDDLNMPAREVYGAQPPIELIRQYMDFKGWYDRKSIGEFRHLVDVNFMGAMGPPGGGRNVVTPRLLRHFNYLAFTEMEDPSKRKIFSIILKSWLDRSENLGHHCKKLVDTCIDTYNTIQTQLLPTPAKSHYTFNLRDLSKVFQGILMADPTKFETIEELLGLWYHESCRVFQDRLVNDEDRDWFEELLANKMKDDFGVDMEAVVTRRPFLYCDFAMEASGEEKPYVYADEHDKLVRTLEESMEDYNQVSTAPMHLVLFMDAVKHVCRVTRIIRQPLGNALLLGMGGSGRQSLTRLSAHVSEFELFQIELSKNYGMTEWRDDLKTVMLKAGLEDTPMVFLFSDTQIKSESFLEDINNILNAGDVPNIYAFEETERIFKTMKPVVADLGQQPTKTNLFSAYTKIVRNNLHTVITMSPLGEIFRARLRQFPALVNCCTIDWFSDWPPEALQSVAFRYLNDIPELECSEEVLHGMVAVCQEMQTSVSMFSSRFLSEMSRYNYVTPTSYLELLGIFSKLIGLKREGIVLQKKRLKAGLDKLMTTSEEVAVMQVELADMRPQLEDAVREAEETMEQIAKDTAVAEETKTKVQAQKATASKKAKEAEAIATDAQKDLDEALPALEAALASLKSLNKNDVVEVRALQRPPEGVRLVMEAVCIMRQVKPKKVAGEKAGEKVNDYWEPGKALLQDPGKFLDSLFQYDKDNIPEFVIKLIQPYIDNPSFTPEAIAKVSKACTSICQWTRAMHTYYFVAKTVAPKRANLAAANAELDETQRVLGEAMEQLHAVERGLAKLQKTYNACVNKKKELEFKCKQCEARLVRADKLIGGLAGEKDRWIETVAMLEDLITKIIGDVLVSAGSVAYQGTFTGDFRAQMVEYWVKQLDKYKVPRTDRPTLVGTMADPVKIRSWQICGLPKDNLSVENGVIAQFSRRWCLFIDPQGQANKWVKNMEKENTIDVIKLSDKDFLRTLENAVRFGKPALLENVGTELDPALEPILMRQVFKQQGTFVIKLGESVIPYHNDFKFYVTTKLPNPHYTPEISTKVTLVNFTLSPSGLQDQLLGLVVAEERPDLEDMKNQLIINNAQMKADLKDIEDKILYKLSTSEGSPVDDVDLIATLEASSVTSAEIKAKVKTAEETEKTIDKTRLEYVPVAVNTQIIFFCVADMSKIDPMYQYSLDWFVTIFVKSIKNAEKAPTLHARIVNINEHFTYSLYCNVCRSLFEKHKLLFAFLLCSRINQHHGIINMDEYRHFVAGGSHKPLEYDNPAPDWISERSWNEILTLGLLDSFQLFVEEFPRFLPGFKKIFDSLEPHRVELPGKWDNLMDDFQKMLVLRALRLDKVTNAMQDYVAVHLGQRFIEPQDTVLSEVFSESSTTTPLIFVLSTGTDPALALYKFAEEKKFSKKLNAISLGQGQGPLAEMLMRSAMSEGRWVFFQNCHLAPSWMPTLESLVEQIDPSKVHKEFRLWLTSMPSSKFPVFILQNGSKMTVEPPKGIKANLLRSYASFKADFLESCGGEKTAIFKNLLFSLCLFHGVLIERRKFGPLGFNIPYEFTDGDLRICISQLKMFLLEYSDIPYKVLTYTAGHINYGGRVTDDWDRRCMMSVLSDFYRREVLVTGHKYSPSGVYYTVAPETSDLAAYMAYLRTLPINDNPEIFGLHDNANITFAQNETNQMLTGLTQLQPKTGAGGGKSREEVMEETAYTILDEVPKPINVAMVMERYPVLYEQSMNTVLVQEVIRYNRLLAIIHSSLHDLLKALKGLVVMSQELEKMANSLYINAVPDMWAGKAYPSLKPLGSWVVDLCQRVVFIREWIDDGIPSVFWISGFFFPQAFLTGTLQNYARKMRIPIDTISFDFKVLFTAWQRLLEPPDDGCYIRGMFLEGARWDAQGMVLAESRPKELFTDMPAIWLTPASNRSPPATGIYACPLYKTLTRAGTLSTTGHSTNFVFTVEIPSDRSQQHWIKRGVAMLCALNY